MLSAFASYSSRDSKYVQQVCAYLKRHMHVFDYESNPGAGSFLTRIDDALDNADVFLAFLGEDVD